MIYLYTLLGITAWVSVVALSSHALISYENTKQAESVRSFVTTTQQQFGNRIIPSQQGQESISTQQSPSKSIPQNTISQPISNPTSIKKTSSNTYYDDKNDEEGEDEDD